jgi:hypothetical protein
MIEDIADAVRVGKSITPSYINSLYRKMASLWRLDVPLGSFPISATILLVSLAAVYIGLGAYLLITYLKRKKPKV